MIVITLFARPRNTVTGDRRIGRVIVLQRHHATGAEDRSDCQLVLEKGACISTSLAPRQAGGEANPLPGTDHPIVRKRIIPDALDVVQRADSSLRFVPDVNNIVQNAIAVTTVDDGDLKHPMSLGEAPESSDPKDRLVLLVALFFDFNESPGENDDRYRVEYAEANEVERQIELETPDARERLHEREAEQKREIAADEPKHDAARSKLPSHAISQPPCDSASIRRFTPGPRLLLGRGTPSRPALGILFSELRETGLDRVRRAAEALSWPDVHFEPGVEVRVKPELHRHLPLGLRRCRASHAVRVATETIKGAPMRVATETLSVSRSSTHAFSARSAEAPSRGGVAVTSDEEISTLAAAIRDRFSEPGEADFALARLYACFGRDQEARAAVRRAVLADTAWRVRMRRDDAVRDVALLELCLRVGPDRRSRRPRRCR